MKVWTQLEKYKPDPKRPLILALGNFDGLHLGHQRILQNVVAHAKKKGGTAAVLTFWEHPQRVLHQSREPGLLTSPQHRLFLFQQAGIEACFFLHFTLPLSKTRPETFVKEWLVERLGVSEVHLGYNAHFGFGRSGDVALMRKLAGELGFAFFETEPVKVRGDYVSSTLIRQAIRSGDLARAREFLGRPFSLFASVVRGKGRGKSIGFPTANLKAHSEILPPRGVYPVEVRERAFHLDSLIDKAEFELELDQPGEWRQGILNFGIRPTFGEEAEEPVPEVFLFDFTGDLYGKTVEVIFHSRLREEKLFRGPQELVKAIEEDIARAQHYFLSQRELFTKRG